MLTIGCDQADPGGKTKPDVYLLLVDTLRADHLSLYGYERPTSPNLDRFARSAVVFEKVVAAAPWTLPAVGSIMTGVYPSAHGLRAKVRAEGMMDLRPGVSTLAETLSGEGYRTVAIVTNPWLTSGQHGVERGFEDYISLDMKNADAVNALSKVLIDKQDPRPLFLYLHYMDPHGPFNRHKKDNDDQLGPLPEQFARPLSAKEKESIPEYMRLNRVGDLGTYIQAYDRSIRYWDNSFGEWLDWLDHREGNANPLVAIVADHGEEFADHEGWSHGETLYEEQLFVPWLMRVPGQAAIRIEDRVVSQIDLAPTILNILDVPVPKTMTGTNALGDDFQADRPVFSETDVRTGGVMASEFVQRSVRRGDEKHILRPTGAECYDLARDHSERRPNCNDVAWYSRSAADLDTWIDENAILAKSLGEGAVVEIEQEQAERLRAIGYVE